MLCVSWDDVNEHYKEFIQYACDSSEAFCLKFQRWQSDDEGKVTDKNVRMVEDEIYQQLKPFLITQYIGARKWMYASGNTKGTVGCVYRCCKETAEILASVGKMSNWFSYLENKYKQDLPWRNMRMPEDLCFLRHNWTWLVTVMHDELCDIYHETNRDRTFLEQAGIKYWYDDYSSHGYFIKYKLKKTGKKYKCPCCGYKTMEHEQAEYYDICPVCFWVNDPIQNKNEEYEEGANSVSLKEARRNYKMFGASRMDVVYWSRDPLEDEK